MTIHSLFSAAMQRFDVKNHIAVAVSGGADSMALCHLLNDRCARHNIALTALTVDHGLRAESAQEAETVAVRLKSQGISHHILTLPQALGKNRLQEDARHARYNVMVEYCRKHDIHYLATGHHLDDQAETVLMRLARGSGLKGLTGMVETRLIESIAVIRPLLKLPKSSLIEYCRENGLDWIEDPSNQNLKFTRAQLRAQKDVLDALGLTSETIEKTRQKLSQAQDFVERAAETALQNCASANGLDYTVFCGLHPYLQQEILERQLKTIGKTGYPPRNEALTRLCDEIRRHDFKAATLHGCKIELKKGILGFSPES